MVSGEKGNCKNSSWTDSLKVQMSISQQRFGRTRLLYSVTALGGRGHGPRPRAFGNPEGAPRLRQN